MSGGHFDYKQFNLESMEETINRDLAKMDFSDDLKDLFGATRIALKVAFVMAHRYDWFLSGDDGTRDYKERLEEELHNVLIEGQSDLKVLLDLISKANKMKEEI